ncbi:MAG: glycosyltransferase family 39 protein [Thermodesulfobacteriota bacterium]|nr:glycosyltransferase family 39 protein [Thermodesulfobacteriota bacterium]
MKSKEKKDFISNDRILFTFLIILILLLIASIVVLSAVPPISKDALVHHLTIPRLYLKHGGMYEIPSMVFSYYPMNLDLIYMLPLYFGNDIIPKFIHFVFALLTAWMLFQYIRHRINIRYGLLGVIFFLSIPIIIKLSISVYVDLGVIFFSTASLLLLLKWIEHDFRVRYLVLSAVCCGLTMGTKYNGLVTCFLLTLFIPFLYSRYSGAGRYVFFRPAAYGVLFLFIALIIYSPWMIRNYHWKNNPIYPLHNKWFNPPESLIKKTVPPATIKKLIEVYLLIEA